jgi:hypothetical protein
MSVLGATPSTRAALLHPVVYLFSVVKPSRFDVQALEQAGVQAKRALHPTTPVSALASELLASEISHILLEDAVRHVVIVDLFINLNFWLYARHAGVEREW